MRVKGHPHFVIELISDVFFFLFCAVFERFPCLSVEDRAAASGTNAAAALATQHGGASGCGSERRERYRLDLPRDGFDGVFSR